MTILIAWWLPLVTPIYRCYHRAGVQHRVVSVPGITTGPCHTSPGQQPAHRIQNKEAESRDRTGYPAELMAGPWLLAAPLSSQLLRLAIFVDYVKFSLFHSNYWLKDKRTAWRFRIKLLCVTQNIEHIYRAPASDYILLEFCSFPTEHMIIITVLL